MRSRRTKDTRHLMALPKAVRVEVGRVDFVLNLCRGKTVLHLGCADEGLTAERLAAGSLMHMRLMQGAKEVWGVDFSREAITKLRALGIPNLVLANVEQLSEVDELRGKRFDLIVASEIIEHLSNPGLFLDSARQLLEDAGAAMVVTVPNAFKATSLRYSLKGLEYVHPDHVCWYSCATIVSLLSRHGYDIQDMRVYSFFDHRMGFRDRLLKALRAISSRIRDRHPPRAPGETTSEARTSARQATVGWVQQLAELAARRLLYKLNPFLADGIIAVVKPGKTCQTGERAK